MEEQGKEVDFSITIKAQGRLQCCRCFFSPCGQRGSPRGVLFLFFVNVIFGFKNISSIFHRTIKEGLFIPYDPLTDGPLPALSSLPSQLFGYGLVLGQIAVMLPEHHPAENQAPTRPQE